MTSKAKPSRTSASLRRRKCVAETLPLFWRLLPSPCVPCGWYFSREMLRWRKTSRPARSCWTSSKQTSVLRGQCNTTMLASATSKLARQSQSLIRRDGILISATTCSLPSHCGALLNLQSSISVTTIPTQTTTSSRTLRCASSMLPRRYSSKATDSTRWSSTTSGVACSCWISVSTSIIAADNLLDDDALTALTSSNTWNATALTRLDIRICYIHLGNNRINDKHAVVDHLASFFPSAEILF